jgi:hypothetical protein
MANSHPILKMSKRLPRNSLRHRVVKNYKADAEGITIEKIIASLFKPTFIIQSHFRGGFFMDFVVAIRVSTVRSN